jgi:hypothetical protein
MALLDLSLLDKMGPEMWLLGVCLVFFGFCLGVVLFFLVRHVLFPGEAYAPKAKLSYIGDVRRTLSVLQHLQAMVGREATGCDPSLADFVSLIRSVQREFGWNASLEGVIQALVAQDIAHQLAERKLKRVAAVEATVTVREVVVA